MAAISWQVLTTGGLGNPTYLTPDQVTVGAAAPTTAAAIEVRLDTAGNWSLVEIAEALEVINRRIQDGRFTQYGQLTVAGV
jgi:hypothetical protein